MAVTVIRSVLLFDGESWKPESTVVFDSEKGVIVAVYNKDKGSKGPAVSKATVIDGTGHTLLPGLIESHMHAHDGHLPKGRDVSFNLRSALRCGITTCCDMHSSPDIIHKLRQKVSEGKRMVENGSLESSMADLKSCLWAATIDGGWPKPVVLGPDPSDEQRAFVASWPNVTPENAAEFVRQQKAAGADYIKLMQEDGTCMAMPEGTIPPASAEVQEAVVKAARKQGLVVVGHALSANNTELLLQAGVDGLTHTFIDKPLPESLLKLYKQTGSFVIPTLVVLSSLTAEEQQRRERFADLARQNGVIDDFSHGIMKEALKVASAEASVGYAFDTLRRFKDEGIDILAGTDSVAGLQGTAVGPSMWMELDMYVEKCGMSIQEALRSATSVPAKRLGFHDRGVIAQGKRADCVLIKGHVSDGLHRLWERDGVAAVWKEGLKVL
ncbi:hypothetical protein XA68_13083 [Ophiocordyceps unilateralis]|uniref:Amidohydrolase-related domain-containing protein n=1 Tax=Ophiocordyceps unilateralis TaxID=268505 RepID=A0A2A9PD89_OPHUN|nr:hypothetical protein XA68_13083 [Ophiocordyceps unilateralis]